MSYRFEVLTKEHAGLTWKFHVSPSSCDGPENYEEYLRFSAVSDHNTGMGTTHILIDDKTDKIAGYVTLRSTALIGENERGSKVMNPALEIAMLAVDQDYERQQIGTVLVSKALIIALGLREGSIGIKHILVCSDPKATGFYEKLKIFAPLNNIYEALYDGSNDNCIPYFTTLPEQLPEEVHTN